MRRHELSSATCGHRGWIALIAVCVAFANVPAGHSAAGAGEPLLAQISGVPTAPGSSSGGGSDPTFRRAMMIVACLAGVFFLSLLCYLVLFRMLLNSYWPRTAYATVSALFWVLSTALVLALFWQSLKYRFTLGEAWYNEHGVRALVIAQGVVIGCLFLFTMRSPGPFPVLVRDKVGTSK